MKLVKSVQDKIIAHAEQENPRESCGLVCIVNGKQKYFPCKNLGVGTDNFVLDPDDYDKADTAGETSLMFKILLLICNILNITLEKYLNAPLLQLPLCVATIAAVANVIGSQQWQWWGQTMAVETEAAAGALNN